MTKNSNINPQPTNWSLGFSWSLVIGHWSFLGLVAALLTFPVFSSEIQIDFKKTNGVIRPLHGVNLGPLCYRGMVDLSRYHRELAIPLTRLHDVVWVNAEAVDIHTIFPEFRNDPERPDSYDFAQTDDYLQSIVNAGSRILYRLGESIEHTPRKYRVHPPQDPEKWAAICLGIIRHYNEGWAKGFRHNIEYWEIWNEPDIGPAMWTGTHEQYFHLYEVTAKAIKARFPNLKVGGPAIGGTGKLEGVGFQASPFMTNFLAYCRERHVPLDFFSWHRYTSKPWELPQFARGVRKVLDEFGFAKTESHLNEWNYLPNDDWRPMLREGQGLMRERWVAEMGGPASAAFAASGLILLQNTPLDMANFYTAEIQAFGMFTFEGVPKKTFYAFKAFREMLETPLRVAAAGNVEGQMAVLAGLKTDQSRANLLLSKFQLPADRINLRLSNLPWPGPTRIEVLAVDSAHNLESVQTNENATGLFEIAFASKAPAVILVKIIPGKAP